MIEISDLSFCFIEILQSHSKVESDAKYTNSKLNFVDLAGSERLGKTQVHTKKPSLLFKSLKLSFHLEILCWKKLNVNL